MTQKVGCDPLSRVDLDANMLAVGDLIHQNHWRGNKCFEYVVWEIGQHANGNTQLQLMRLPRNGSTARAGRTSVFANATGQLNGYHSGDQLDVYFAKQKRNRGRRNP